MQPLVQSAIDAANRGENNKALEFLKQALAANPNDVDAWLVVAAVVEQPERKRQCLNRVLALDPTNQIARDELLEMDRAALGHVPPFTTEPVADTTAPQYQTAPPPSNYSDSPSAFEREPDPVSRPTYQFAPSSPDYPTSTSAFEPESTPKQSAPAAPQPQAKAQTESKPAPKARAEKTLVFKSPLLWRIVMYFMVAMFSCGALFMISQKELGGTLFVLTLAFLMGVGAMALSKKVEVSDSGIRASGVLGSSEARWNEIKSIKSSSMKQRLELYKSNGQVVKVSNQVSGYPQIVEILRKRRPDLFGMAASASNSYGSAAPAPAFTGTRTFRRSFIKQYGLLFVLIPICLLFAWLGFQDPKLQLGAFVTAGVCLLFILGTLLMVNTVKVEPNRLIMETFFSQKEFSARQIAEIKIQSVRGRYGRVNHYVQITTAEGKVHALEGFSEGDDIIYGILTNWWDTYRNR